MPQARCIIATLAMASPSNINVLTTSVMVLEMLHTVTIAKHRHDTEALIHVAVSSMNSKKLFRLPLRSKN